MSLTDQASKPASGLNPRWSRLIRLHLGMTLLGAGAGISFPFVADLLTGTASAGISLVGLLCALPIMAAGTALTFSVLGRSTAQPDTLRQP